MPLTRRTGRSILGFQRQKFLGAGLDEQLRCRSSLATGAIPWTAGAEALRPSGRSPAHAALQPPYRRGLHWIRRFLLFHNGTPPRKLAENDLNRFLTHLAIGEKVAASTQNQALAAVLFLYEHVLEQPLDRIEGVVRARNAKRLPVVLTRDEVQAILAQMDGAPRLVCTLLYGSGLRLLEGLRLRVKDLDFGRGEITVREGKGQKDRVTMLPEALRQALQDHLRRVRQQHGNDLKSGLGQVPLPDALARKYPNANREWGWQWVFPASSHYVERGTGIRHRHHLHESVIQKAVHQAAHRAGLAKRVTTHAFPHSFATRLLEDGYDIRTVQELLGHKDVQTTMVYTHVLNRGGRGVHSPLDRLRKASSGELGGIIRTYRSA